MSKFFKLTFLIVILIFALNITAFAGLPLHEVHYSKANIVNGAVDFSTAKFSHLEIFFASSDAEVKENHLHVTGNLKLSSGNYSYWDGVNLIRNSGEARTVKLALGNDITQTGSHKSIKFIPVNDAGEQVYFYSEADSGLNGVEATWRLTDAKEFNSYMNLPNIRSTSQQLVTFVPYLEYIPVSLDVEYEISRDVVLSDDEGEEYHETIFETITESLVLDDLMTGFNLRLVNANNPSVAVALPSKTTLAIENIYTVSGDEISVPTDNNITVSTGETIVTSMDFGGMISTDQIAFINVRVETVENGLTNTYKWRFYGNKLAGTTRLLSNHVSEAKYKNDASYYKGAKFKGLYLVLNNSDRPMESQYITTGSIDIPAGGYTIYDADKSNKLSTVPEGTVKTLPLIPAQSLSEKNFGPQYFIGNDSKKRRRILLKGDVEKNLGGKTISWTFPDNLNLSGATILPNYSTTDEQLETFVPYVETISSDNNAISALRYRLVKEDDTGTVISPDFRVDFYISVSINDIETYNSGWLENSCEGALELGSSYSVNSLSCITVMIRTFEDDLNPLEPCTYQWDFKGTKKSSDSSGDTQEFDGCNLNFGLTGIFMIIAFCMFKKICRISR